VAETFEQYTARIASYVAGRDPMEILRATPRELTRAVGSATRRRLMARPARGKWSPGEIVAHLSELELLWGCRLRLILGQPGVPIVGMDQNVWARNSRYRRLDPRRSLEQFVAIRRANLELLGRLTPAERKRWGAHSQFGRLTVTRLTQLLAGHDRNHLRQIEERLPTRRKRARR